MKECRKTKLLDSLVQTYCYNQRSIVSNQTPCVGHHIVGRSNKLLRWEIKNIAMVTTKEHDLIHRGLLNPRYEYQDYLDEMRNKSFKQYLLENGLTVDEFLDERIKYWKELIC